MGEWKEFSFTEICHIIGGGTPKTSIVEYWDGDIPWLSVKDFNKDSRYVYDTEKHITEQGLKHSSTKILNKNDIIISARGTVGEIAMISKPMAFNQSCYGLKAKNGFNKIFLYYLLKNNIKKFKIVTHGSVFDTITRKTFENIYVKVPDYETQKNIANLLEVLDNKIQLNNRINDNLEAQAKALYHNMVKNIEPNGILTDIANVVMGQSPKGTSYNEQGEGEIFFQGRTDFGDRFPSIRQYTTEPKRFADEGDILMSVRAPVGDINIANHRCCIGRGLASISSNDHHQSFVLYTMFSIKDALNVFNGEGTVFGSINAKSLKEMPIRIPSVLAIKEFEKNVSLIDKLIFKNYEEISKLINIRDILLPKLMSGEIDVSNIDI